MFWRKHDAMLTTTFLTLYHLAGFIIGGQEKWQCQYSWIKFAQGNYPGEKSLTPSLRRRLSYGNIMSSVPLTSMKITKRSSTWLRCSFPYVVANDSQSSKRQSLVLNFVIPDLLSQRAIQAPGICLTAEIATLEAFVAIKTSNVKQQRSMTCAGS